MRALWLCLLGLLVLVLGVVSADDPAPAYATDTVEREQKAATTAVDETPTEHEAVPIDTEEDDMATPTEHVTSSAPMETDSENIDAADGITAPPPHDDHHDHYASVRDEAVQDGLPSEAPPAQHHGHPDDGHRTVQTETTDSDLQIPGPCGGRGADATNDDHPQEQCGGAARSVDVTDNGAEDPSHDGYPAAGVDDHRDPLQDQQEDTKDRGGLAEDLRQFAEDHAAELQGSDHLFEEVASSSGHPASPDSPLDPEDFQGHLDGHVEHDHGGSPRDLHPDDQHYDQDDVDSSDVDPSLAPPPRAIVPLYVDERDRPANVAMIVVHPTTPSAADALDMTIRQVLAAHRVSVLAVGEEPAATVRDSHIAKEQHFRYAAGATQPPASIVSAVGSSPIRETFKRCFGVSLSSLLRHDAPSTQTSSSSSSASQPGKTDAGSDEEVEVRQLYSAEEAIAAGVAPSAKALYALWWTSVLEHRRSSSSSTDGGHTTLPEDDKKNAADAACGAYGVEIAPSAFVTHLPYHDHDDRSAFVVNAFYPHLVRSMEQEGLVNVWFAVSWPEAAMTWGEFNHRVVGNVDPAAAQPGSIRRTLHDAWRLLQLPESPTDFTNCVGASASALSTIHEMPLWGASDSFNGTLFARRAAQWPEVSDIAAIDETGVGLPLDFIERAGAFAHELRLPVPVEDLLPDPPFAPTSKPPTSPNEAPQEDEGSAVKRTTDADQAEKRSSASGRLTLVTLEELLAGRQTTTVIRLLRTHRAAIERALKRVADDGAVPLASEPWMFLPLSKTTPPIPRPDSDPFASGPLHHGQPLDTTASSTTPATSESTTSDVTPSRSTSSSQSQGSPSAPKTKTFTMTLKQAPKAPPAPTPPDDSHDPEPIVITVGGKVFDLTPNHAWHKEKNDNAAADGGLSLDLSSLGDVLGKGMKIQGLTIGGVDLLGGSVRKSLATAAGSSSQRPAAFKLTQPTPAVMRANAAGAADGKPSGSDGESASPPDDVSSVNTAMLLLKPRLFEKLKPTSDLSDDSDKMKAARAAYAGAYEATLRLIFASVAEQLRGKVLDVGTLSGSDLKSKGTIDQHYAALSGPALALSSAALPVVVEEPAALTFRKAFGAPFGDSTRKAVAIDDALRNFGGIPGLRPMKSPVAQKKDTGDKKKRKKKKKDMSPAELVALVRSLVAREQDRAAAVESVVSGIVDGGGGVPLFTAAQAVALRLFPNATALEAAPPLAFVKLQTDVYATKLAVDAATIPDMARRLLQHSRCSSDADTNGGDAPPLLCVGVVNGFYPQMRDDFLHDDAVTVWLHIAWPVAHMPWDRFRSEFAGVTDPAKAHPESIRAKFLTSHKTLGLLEQPTKGNNGLHASAGPVEAAKELALFTGAKLDETPFFAPLMQQEELSEDVRETSGSADGRREEEHGAGPHDRGASSSVSKLSVGDVHRLISNPLLPLAENDGHPGGESVWASVFDHTELMDTAQARDIVRRLTAAAQVVLSGQAPDRTLLPSSDPPPPFDDAHGDSGRHKEFVKEQATALMAGIEPQPYTIDKAALEQRAIAAAAETKAKVDEAEAARMKAQIDATKQSIDAVEALKTAAERRAASSTPLHAVHPAVAATTAKSPATGDLPGTSSGLDVKADDTADEEASGVRSEVEALMRRPEGNAINAAEAQLIASHLRNRTVAAFLCKQFCEPIHVPRLPRTPASDGTGGDGAAIDSGQRGSTDEAGTAQSLDQSQKGDLKAHTALLRRRLREVTPVSFLAAAVGAHLPVTLPPKLQPLSTPEDAAATVTARDLQVFLEQRAFDHTCASSSASSESIEEQSLLFDGFVAEERRAVMCPHRSRALLAHASLSSAGLIVPLDESLAARLRAEALRAAEDDVITFATLQHNAAHGPLDSATEETVTSMGTASSGGNSDRKNGAERSGETAASRNRVVLLEHWRSVRSSLFGAAAAHAREVAARAATQLSTAHQFGTPARSCSLALAFRTRAMEAFEPLEVIPPSPEENVDASNASDATVRAAQAMAGVVEGSDTVSARRRAFLTGSAHLTATAGNYVEDYALLWEKAPFAAANARTRNFARAVVTPRRAGYASVTHDPAALKRQIDYSKEDSAATAAMTQRETVSKRQMAAAASFKAAVQWSRAPKRHAAAVHTARKAHWSVAARNGAVTETAAAATAMFGYARYDALSMLAAAAHPASTATPAVDLNRTVVCSALHFSLRAAQTAVATRRRQALLRQAAAASRVSDATVIKTGLAANRKLKAFRATVEQRALPPVVTAASAYHSIGTALRDLVAHRCPAVAGREARVLRSSAAYFNVSAVGGSCRAFHDLAESIDAGLIEVPSTSTRRTLMETTASPAAAPWWFRLFSESVATDARPPSRHQGAGTTSSNSAKETAADQKAASNSTTPKRKKATAAAGESLREAKLYGRRRRSVPSVFDTGLLQAGVPVTTEQHAAMLHQLGRDCGDFRATAAQARAAIAHVVVRSAKGRRTSTAPEPPSPLLDAEHETRALRTAEDLLARRNAVLRDPTATTTSSTARGEAAEENTRMSSDVSSEPTANTIPTRVQLRWRPSKARALTSPLEPKGDGSTAAHPAVLTTTACETALRETDVFAKTVASEQALLRMWHDRAFFRQSCAPASPHLAAPAIWWKVLDTDGSSIVADAGDGMLAYSSRRRGKSVQGPVKHRESLAANIDEDTVFGRRAKKFPATPRGAASPFDAHSAKRVTAGSIGPDNAYALAVLEALEHWRGVGDWRLLDDALSMLDGGRQFAGHHEDADGSVPAAAQSPAGNGETKTAKAEEEPFWSTAAAAVGAAVKQTMSWVSAIFGELPPCDFSTEPTETSLWHVQLTLREESKSDQTVTDDGAVASAPPRDNSAAALALWRTLSTIRTNDARNVIDARHTSAHLSGVMEATVLGRGATSERDPWPRRAASIALELRLGDDARHTAAAHIAATDALANETYVKEMLRRADAHYFRCALVPPPLLRSQECAHRLLGSLGGARRPDLAGYLKTLYDVGHASGHHVRRFVPFMPMLRSATTALQESWARAESTISHAPNPRRNSRYNERPPEKMVDDEVAAFHRVVTAALSPSPHAQGSSGGEQDTDPVDAAVDVIVRYALETHAKAVAVEARQRVRSVAAKHMALLAKGDSSLLAAEDVPRAPGAVGRRLKTFMAPKSGDKSDDDRAGRKKNSKKGSRTGTDSTGAKGGGTKLSSSGGYEEEEPQPGSHKYHAEGLEAATSVIGLQSVQGLADVSALTAGSLTTKDVDAAAAKLIAWYFVSTNPQGGSRVAKGAKDRDDRQNGPLAQAVDVDTAAEGKCPLCAALGIAALRMSRRIAEAFPGLHAASETLRGRRSVRFGDDFLAPRLPLDAAVPRLLSSAPRGSGLLPPHLLALKQEDESRSLPIFSFNALSPTRLATAILSNATAVLEAVAGATKIVDAVTDEDCAPRKAAHGARSGDGREEKETERTADQGVGGHRPTSHCAFPVVAYSVSDGLVEVRRPPLSTLRPTADRGVPTDAPGSSEELFE